MPEHRVDRRVHRPAAPRQDRQLHPHLLSLPPPPPPPLCHFTSLVSSFPSRCSTSRRSDLCPPGPLATSSQASFTSWPQTNRLDLQWAPIGSFGYQMLDRPDALVFSLSCLVWILTWHSQKRPTVRRWFRSPQSFCRGAASAQHVCSSWWIHPPVPVLARYYKKIQNV